MKLVRIICKDRIDFKMSAPPGSRVRGFCDICISGFIAFLAFLLCGFSQYAKSLSLESRGISGPCFRRGGSKRLL